MKKMKHRSDTLEIQWKRLVSMVDEAATAFVRTSFSVLVREANDFAVVLTDARRPLARAVDHVDLRRSSAACRRRSSISSTYFRRIR